MALPLEGIRVVECTMFQQGPVAGYMLGDLGADVIKVEGRAGGDPGRAMISMTGILTGGGETDRNFYFENNNRNKRSITIDLQKEEGKEVLLRLIEQADVFLQNWAGGVAERLGLDYETMKKRNPRLIYAHASGWGPEGPDREEPSADYTGLGRSGMMYFSGEEGMPPLGYVPGIADQMGAIMTAYGILSALIARERHGIGQKVDASLLGSIVAGLGGIVMSIKLITGLELKRVSRTKAGSPLWNHYGCADGKWLALACLQADRYWPDFCRVMGIEEYEKDPRFENQFVRAQHSAEIIGIIDKAFATRTREEWIKLFKAAEIPYSVINTVSDAVVDPQTIANEYVTDYEHPVYGKIKVTGFPIRLSETPLSIRREAPELGQHTEEVLLEHGYDWDEIIKLKDAEVI